MLKFTRVLLAAVLALPFATEASAQDRMPNMPRAGEQSAAAETHGVGVVQSVDPKAGTVTIAHEPIQGLNWPAMTMSFKVAKPELLEGVSAGRKVEFMLQGKDMSAIITSLKAAE